MALLLFLFGAALGSFLKVLADRYEPEQFLLNPRVIGGRSRCPRCERTLRWYELIPVISFIVQAGRCRGCRGKISLHYPTIEIVCGLIFIFVPRVVLAMTQTPDLYSCAAAAVWVGIFLTLLLITLIDIRLHLIPDEATIFVAVLGGALLFLSGSGFGTTEGSFIGPYAAMFGMRSSIWMNHAFASLFGTLFFAVLVLGTRGRGMGMGDVKLAAALGLLFGWPDILLLIGFAFVMGALVGVPLLLFGKKTMKSALPFGPFLAASGTFVFFFGEMAARWYFSLLTS